jgi:predicted lipoprotein with Yx(FWY)xxD motif
MNIITRTGGWMALALSAVALAAGCGGSSAASGTGAAAGANGTGSGLVVSTAPSPKLGTTVLVNSHGMTLYSLSAERDGRFICTRGSTIPGGSVSCLSVWRPLIASGPVAGQGVSSLSTIVRPDGAGRQVTYKGLPLYTFANDTAPGDASGNGFRDVGTWLAATSNGSAAPAPPATTSSPYGY